MKGPPLIKTLLLGSWMVLHRRRPLHGLFVGGVGRWALAFLASGWLGGRGLSVSPRGLHARRTFMGRYAKSPVDAHLALAAEMTPSTGDRLSTLDADATQRHNLQ